MERQKSDMYPIDRFSNEYGSAAGDPGYVKKMREILEAIAIKERVISVIRIYESAVPKNS